MKSIQIILLMSIVMLSGIKVAAQQEQKKQVAKEQRQVHKEGRENKEIPIPNLSEEQKSKIKEIRLKERKANLQLKNKEKEIEAHLKTLNAEDKPNITEINKSVDELFAIKSNRKKNKIAAKQEIRALLNDEQKLAFDLRQQNKKRKGPEAPHAPKSPAPPPSPGKK